MATKYFEKASYEACLIDGGTPDDMAANKTTYTWTADGGSIQIHWKREGTDKEQNHTVLKAGTVVIVDKVNKTITIKEVT